MVFSGTPIRATMLLMLAIPLMECASSAPSCKVDADCASGEACDTGSGDCQPATPSTTGEQPGETPPSAMPTVPGGGCQVGRFYCGGNKVEGDPSTRYICLAPDKAGLDRVCALGCKVSTSGADDFCAEPPSVDPTVPGGGCQVGGYYCGGDKVVGDGSTLYVCIAGDLAKLDRGCPHGCQVNTARDDECKPDPAHLIVPGGGCKPGGTYCGGDKVSGDANILYLCIAGDQAQVSRVCNKGCQVNQAKNDACK